MNDLSHEQAREYIQQGHQDDWAALRQHLAACDECRAYAALHVRLLRELPARNARAYPTVEQRAAVLTAAGRGSAAPRFWRLLSMAGGFAAVLFMATAFWLVRSAIDSSAARARPPVPLATFLAPFLPDVTATPRPTQPAPTPTPAGTPDPRGRYVIDTVPAPSLAGNLIGEPLEQEIAIYLPPSYDNSNRRYPVVYALLIITDNDVNPLEALASSARTGMYLALQNGLAREMIVVVPDSTTVLNTVNFFASSPVVGDWEGYITSDLVSYIDRHYRTIPAAKSRGLLGEGHAGLGALTIAMNHPDLFSAVYLQQPLVLPPGMLGQSGFVSPLMRRPVVDLLNSIVGLQPEEALAKIHRQMYPASGQTARVAQEAVAYGITFVPTVDGRIPYFEYPYADHEGGPDMVIWRKWEAGLGNIPAKLQPHVDVLKTLAVAILQGENADIGGQTVFYDEGPAYLSDQLTAAGVPHRFNVSDATWIRQLGEDVFPYFSEVLSPD